MLAKLRIEIEKRLTPAQFAVLRKRGTERAWSSSLDKESRRGVLHCAGCDLALFSSDTKFDSGTGCPSFWAPLPNAIGTTTDRSLFMVRTEVHCWRCGGHLGHDKRHRLGRWILTERRRQPFGGLTTYMLRCGTYRAHPDSARPTSPTIRRGARHRVRGL